MASNSESYLSESSESINFYEIIKLCILCNEANQLESGKNTARNVLRICSGNASGVINLTLMREF